MALLWKMICNLGDPMSLRHPVVCNVVYQGPLYYASIRQKKSFELTS